MPAPPKPKGQPTDLHEVERALSVLQGRHPEHERARREDEEARKRRSTEIDAVARVETKHVRSRRLTILAVTVPVVALFAFIGVYGRREMARRARIDAVSESFRAYGFTPLDTSLRGSTGRVESAAEPGCMLAVSTSAAPLTITRGGASTEAAAPALFCTCKSERIAVTSPVGDEGGIALLRADAATIGGSRAFAHLPFKPASRLNTDEACGEESLDAWIDAKHYPPPVLEGGEEGAMQAALRGKLGALGFRVAGVVKSDVPFVLVEVPKESCALATSASQTGTVRLRVKGEGAANVEGAGTVGRCAREASTMLVSREGAEEVTVLVAPALAVGGVKGLREITDRSELALSGVAVPAADRPWDAKQLLLASAIPEADVTTASTPDVAAEPEARVVALSFDTPSALGPVTDTGVFSFCSPALDADVREAVCVFSGAQKWRTAGAEAVGGMARAKLPFWLFTMQGVSEPIALKGITQLLSLARSLQREGFAPTTLEALTELPAGVEVLGRTGEDAVVVVGVAAGEPWVYPLTDGPAWTLDGLPRIVAVKPLEKIVLTAKGKTLPPRAARRTVVFRRQVQPQAH